MSERKHPPSGEPKPGYPEPNWAGHLELFYLGSLAFVAILMVLSCIFGWF